MAGKSVNKVILIGNLGKDPEVKYTPQGTPVAKLTSPPTSVSKIRAASGRTAPSGTIRALWQRLAEIAGEYLKKGGKVYIEGRLQTRSWDDKNSGQKKYMTEIVANDLVLLSGRGEGSGGETSAALAARRHLAAAAATTSTSAARTRPPRRLRPDHRRRYSVLTNLPRGLRLPFDRELVEAQLALGLVTSSDMPQLDWDALEANLDGKAIRRLGAFVEPTPFEIADVLPRAMEEMSLVRLSIEEAAERLAKLRAAEILRDGRDPLGYTREFEGLWIRTDYSKSLEAVGTLKDEVFVAREIGQSESLIRAWVLDRLREFLKASTTA